MISPDIVVKARHFEISSQFRDHVGEKFARVSRFGVPLRTIDVELSKETNPRLADHAFEVELTCRGKGPVIRAEAAAADQFTALDQAYARLEERLRRHADRHRFHRHGRATARLSDREWNGQPESIFPASERTEVAGGAQEGDEASSNSENTVLEMGPLVVREKVHHTEPMSVEQAVTEMELVGHDFFLFVEQATSDTVLVYRRRGYNYGLIRVNAGGKDG